MYSKQLMIGLEPEVAALHCLAGVQMDVGTKYMVVDCGGQIIGES